MDLITPDFGLIFWQTLIFLIVLFVLGKFAWKPIIGALKSREASIESALKSAKKARNDIQLLKEENEKLIAEAKAERDKIIKEAQNSANIIHDKAKVEAQKTGDRMIEEARESIRSEKDMALKAIKDQVAELSILVSGKLLKKNLESDKAQENLIKDYIKDLKIN
jgi:F-type H+-transporting ATPase subunit b